MTSRLGILLAAFTVTASLSQAQTGALQEGRLTGRGKAALTVTSGRHVTDAAVVVNLDGAISSGGLREASFRVKSTGTAIPVVIDGLEHGSDELQVDIVNGMIRFDRPGSCHLDGTGNVTVAEIQFTGSVSLDGTLDPGGAIVFSVALGERGERGTMTGTGTWTSGPGFRFVSGPGAKTQLLKGRYSGQLHGTVLGEPYAGVLVIEFDGSGGVAGGRYAHRNGLLYVESVISPAGSTYSVDVDGFGELMFWVAPRPHLYRIAVADNGNIVKLGSKQGFVLPPDIIVSGELVKQ